MDIPSLFVPHWPTGVDAWESVVTLFILGAFKMDRGRNMWRRASQIDRFGWSIVIYDWVFGAVAFLTLLWLFYPGLDPAHWLSRITTALLCMVAVWQWFEMRCSPQVRVELVASGVVVVGDGWQPGDGERRGLVRRAIDRSHHLDPAYSIDDVHPIPEGE